MMIGLLGAAGSTFAQTFETKAGQAYLVDGETGAVLFAKNPDQPFPPASLAKLMTIELVFQAMRSGRVSIEDSYHVSEHAWRTGGAPSRTATMFAAVNSTVPLEALVQGIIVQQANDACIIIAEGLAGSEENFARLMTERARAIGLQVSTFVNATGLPADGQAVTTRELALLSRQLWREYPAYYRTFAQADFEWNGIFQRNRNPLLAMNIGADGLATGFAEGAGYAIAASVERDGRRLFAALAGLASEDERASETRQILDWGMRTFALATPFAPGEVIGEARVYGGEKGSVGLRAEGAVSTYVPRFEPERLSARIVYRGPVSAPIAEGQEIGRLQFWIDGTLSREEPLFAVEGVGQGTLGRRSLDAIGELLLGWLR